MPWKGGKRLSRMARCLRWLLLLPLLLTAAQARSAECDDQTAIWTTSERGGISHRLYHTAGVFFIEEWRHSKRAWRTLASWTSCSNGESTCTAFFRAQTGEVSATIEWIDDNEDGLAEWVVLADLEQQFYYGGGATVEWDDGFARVDGERPGPRSNAYKFLSCRTEPIALDKSTPFVAAASYNRIVSDHASLSDRQAFANAPGSIWWMTGARIEAADFSCKVKSFNKDRTVSASCAPKPDGTSRERNFSFRYQGGVVFLDGQQLDMITD